MPPSVSAECAMVCTRCQRGLEYIRKATYVFYGSRFAVDIELLASRNHRTHEQRAIAAIEVGILTSRAGSLILHALRTIRAGLFADPEAFSAGSDWSKVDRCCRIDCNEGEILAWRSVGGGGEGCNGGEDDRGLHVVCVERKME